MQQELSWNVEDYGARQYDPVVGRWLEVDPLTSQFPSWSPYSAFFDNPIYVKLEENRAILRVVEINLKFKKLLLTK